MSHCFQQFSKSSVVMNDSIVITGTIVIIWTFVYSNRNCQVGWLFEKYLGNWSKLSKAYDCSY